MSYTVVIPSKNSDNLKTCVAGIRDSGEDCRIVVIDDGLDEKVPGTVQIPGLKPFCYSRNVNIGIVFSRPDDVILLNDDAILKTPGGFGVLKHAAEKHPEVGILGSVCNSIGNLNQFPRDCGLRFDKRMVCFVCVYIPRKTIDLVGLLDERFVHYGIEDDDYCLRIRKAGLKIGIHDGCFVDHSMLHSSYRGEAGAGGDYRPNLEIFKEKWGMDNWGRKVL